MNCRYVLLVSLAAVLLYSCKTNKNICAVACSEAPTAIGPYSQAAKVGNTVYCSGQIGLSPITNALVGDDVGSQAHQALKNLQAVLKASGTDMEHVVKVTVYLKDLNDFAKINEIYKNYFPALKPARATVQVSRLPKDALIEIDCIAIAE
jgi:2-iminobutanoate/2-iminopropanoate deaminase